MTSKKASNYSKKTKKKKWSKPCVKVEKVNVEEYWGVTTVSTSP